MGTATNQAEIKSGCTEKAKFLIPWAGKILSYCPVHANQLAVIAKVIGTPMHTQLLPPDTLRICESKEILSDEEKELAKEFPL